MAIVLESEEISLRSSGVGDRVSHGFVRGAGFLISGLREFGLRFPITVEVILRPYSTDEIIQRKILVEARKGQLSRQLSYLSELDYGSPARVEGRAQLHKILDELHDAKYGVERRVVVSIRGHERLRISSPAFIADDYSLAPLYY